MRYLKLLSIFLVLSLGVQNRCLAVDLSGLREWVPNFFKHSYAQTETAEPGTEQLSEADDSPPKRSLKYLRSLPGNAWGWVKENPCSTLTVVGVIGVLISLGTLILHKRGLEYQALYDEHTNLEALYNGLFQSCEQILNATVSPIRENVTDAISECLENATTHLQNCEERCSEKLSSFNETFEVLQQNLTRAWEGKVAELEGSLTRLGEVNEWLQGNLTQLSKKLFDSEKENADLRGQIPEIVRTSIYAADDKSSLLSSEGFWECIGNAVQAAREMPGFVRKCVLEHLIKGN